MFVATELAHRDEGIHVVDLPFEISRIPPKLRRTTVVQHAAQALAARTSLAIMAPEHMSRADEPVLVRHVQLQRGSGTQHAGPSDQRYVVKVDDVECAFAEDAPDLCSMD